MSLAAPVSNKEVKRLTRHSELFRLNLSQKFLPKKEALDLLTVVETSQLQARLIFSGMGLV